MSIQSWKEEFMPESATKAGSEGRIPAIEHSIQKWRGLLTENLEKHGVEKEGIFLVNRQGNESDLLIGAAGTCALCDYTERQPRLYRNRNACERCPIWEARMETCADIYEHAARATTNSGQSAVREMVKLLQEVLEFHGG